MNVFTAAIVPPNGSEDILDDMDEIIDELQEANIKEYKHELKSDVRDPIKKLLKLLVYYDKLLNMEQVTIMQKGKMLQIVG